MAKQKRIKDLEQAVNPEPDEGPLNIVILDEDENGVIRYKGKIITPAELEEIERTTPPSLFIHITNEEPKP